MSPTETLRPADLAAANAVITSLAGPEATLRADQLEAITGLMRPAARVLVVQATGWGKSAVYWAATAILRGRTASGPEVTGAGSETRGGATLIVSPLLSLMRDQVAAAGRAGLRAATLNSSTLDELRVAARKPARPAAAT